MGLSFLTPLGGLLALAALLPLAAFALFERRARRVRALLRLPEPPPRARAPAVLSLVGVPALLALAASQPVVDHVRTRYARTDAEAFFVLDTSRSMLARQAMTAPTRLDRAKAAALRIRANLPDVPVGIASLSDRTLPHLFPTADPTVFGATLERALGIERPPPTSGFRSRITTLGALSTTATHNFFSATARNRLLVVFSDFESRPFVDRSLSALFRRPPAIRAVFVRFWSPTERVYSEGQVESEYAPDPASFETEQRLARAVGGSAFAETDIGGAGRRVRELVGRGDKAALGRDLGRTALAPYIALAALVPLSFLLWRRNL